MTVQFYQNIRLEFVDKTQLISILHDWMDLGPVLIGWTMNLIPGQFILLIKTASKLCKNWVSNKQNSPPAACWEKYEIWNMNRYASKAFIKYFWTRNDSILYHNGNFHCPNQPLTVTTHHINFYLIEGEGWGLEALERHQIFFGRDLSKYIKHIPLDKWLPSPLPPSLM